MYKAQTYTILVVSSRLYGPRLLKLAMLVIHQISWQHQRFLSLHACTSRGVLRCSARPTGIANTARLTGIKRPTMMISAIGSRHRAAIRIAPFSMNTGTAQQTVLTSTALPIILASAVHLTGSTADNRDRHCKFRWHCTISHRDKQSTVFRHNTAHKIDRRGTAYKLNSSQIH